MSAVQVLNDPVDIPGTRTLRTRKASRHRVDATVEAESRSGEIEQVVVRDISAFGCSISAEAEWLRLGKFVTLNVGNVRRIEAIVRWTRNGVAGLEFLRPIPFGDAEIISNYIEE
jgi:PilZ domain